MNWSIQELAKLAGTTSRALRHYDEVGLLPPSSVGANGYRYYDERALLRLQRILLLRELGLGLPQIAEILDRHTSEQRALEAHLAWLQQEHARLGRQVAAVTSTLGALRGGTGLVAEKMFEGFDHTRYKDEVEARWGRDAFARGDAWWRGMSDAERATWTQRTAQLSADWASAARARLTPDSAPAQALAARHLEWLRAIPGTPANRPDGDAKSYLLGLGDMYVTDPRFAANYGSDDNGVGAQFVRDSLRIYAAENL